MRFLKFKIHVIIIQSDHDSFKAENFVVISAATKKIFFMDIAFVIIANV